MDLEKNLRLKIDVKTFEDLPLLDVKTKMMIGKKNNKLDILFPEDYIGQNVTFLI